MKSHVLSLTHGPGERLLELSLVLFVQSDNVYSVQGKVSAERSGYYM